ncbi:MAG: cell surface protein SprA, partial [Bacteroidaceae bacterium]|nr:cell surface protein SprA [Bacteroidaceae bacterium]
NDNYHYFRGSDYDRDKVSVLNRYKRINMPQGNSPDSENSPETYETAWKNTPDIEDINTDYTLGESEKYWQYHLPITPENLRPGGKYVSDTRTATVTLRNGEIENIDWYLIRIPLQDSDRESIGGISDFSNIRFMRMFMTNFTDEVILRFGTFDLVHGDWRTYENTLYAGNVASSANTDFTITAVNIEENNDRVPVNYVVPPGISRVTDAASGTLMESNEQALALTVKNLGPNDARAVYKSVKYDMRKYKHLQLFAHANQLEASDPDMTPLQNGQVSVFLRLGSDYRNNYYEYEIPLELTPIKSSGKYSNNSYEDRVAVWPESNMFDFNLDMLVDLKRQRNKNGVSYSQLYTGYDPEKPSNRIAVIGNPSLGEVKTIMIGIRNHADANRSVEVWVNELRLQEYTNEGGWAAQGNLNIQLSDIGSFSATGKMVTAGFGGIEQTVAERSDKDDYQYQFTTSGDLGRLLPEKAKVSVPVYYSYSKHIVKPKYNPLDTDMLLSEALDATQTQEEKDSIISLTSTISANRNFSISGAKVNIASKKHPMPYDPANFSFSYASSHSENRGETTVYEYNDSWKASMSYVWSPNWKNWEPFKKWNTKSKWAQIIKDQNIAFAPQSLTFNTDLGRTYYELQERDLENIGNSQALPVTWSSSYLWNRNFSLRWDIFKALHFSFQSATHAEVEQPNVVINKDLYPDEYQAWKDSVNMSLAGFGRPLDYSQSATMSYKLPINKLPAFDWITADASYNSQYSWKRGAELEDGSSLGHSINTQRSINANGKLALETLYNKSPFLKEVNRIFSASNAKSEANKKRNDKKREKEKEQREKDKLEEARLKAEEESKKTGESVDSILARTMGKGTTQTNAKGTSAQKDRKKRTQGYAREIVLAPDSNMTITHNQKSKRLEVRIQDSTGNDYKVKYKKLDENKIVLMTKSMDTAKVRINVIAKPKLSEQGWYKWAQAAARFAMMVRNVSVSYRNTYNLSMSGFMPEVGDMFGQRMTSAHGFAPGVGFGFGLVSDDYIETAKERGWLLCADSLSTPATSSTTEDLQIKASLEPFTDMKIDLNMSRTMNRSKSIQYMYQGSPTTQTGSFNMTIVSLSSAFSGSGNASNGYYSPSFEKFRAMLPLYQQRVEAQYIGGKDPAGVTYLGSAGDPAKGNVTPANMYGADVMIPAFLAAYTGGGTTRELNIFPSLARMLPNWTLTYKGLSNLPFIRDYFKSVTVSHGYKSVYAVGSYNSYASWMEFMNGTDLGFTQSQATGTYSPSSCYDISTVSINESFAPLIGLNFTFHNNMTLKAEYRTTRVMSLSITSAQLTETGSRDFVLGWGYKINDFRLGSIFGSKRASQKAMKSTAKNRALKNRDTGSDGRENIKNSSKSNFAHALSLRFDFSIRNQDAIRRDIQTGLSEATSGNKAVKASFRADYTMSRYVTMTLFYDRQRTVPLLSSSAYPTVTQDFGLSMKFALTR